MKKTTNNKGFTIIEVLIVLAIAGIIMLVVFLAVPALQRNSRNTQRRSDVSHVVGIINEYSANHSGQLPTGAQLVTAMTNENLATMTKPVAADMLASGVTTASGTTSVMKIHPGTVCDVTTNNPSTTGASSKSFVIEFEVETGGGAEDACING